MKKILTSILLVFTFTFFSLNNVNAITIGGVEVEKICKEDYSATLEEYKKMISNYQNWNFIEIGDMLVIELNLGNEDTMSNIKNQDGNPTEIFHTGFELKKSYITIDFDKIFAGTIEQFEIVGDYNGWEHKKKSAYSDGEEIVYKLKIKKDAAKKIANNLKGEELNITINLEGCSKESSSFRLPQNFIGKYYGYNSGNSNSSTIKPTDTDKIVCGIFKEDGELLKIIKNLYKILKIAIPLLVAVLTIVEFFKVLFSGEDKTMKEAFQATVKRFILIIVIIFLPILIEFIIRIAGLSENCLQHFL